jgi:hypothetical protein
MTADPYAGVGAALIVIVVPSSSGPKTDQEPPGHPAQRAR